MLTATSRLPYFWQEPTYHQFRQRLHGQFPHAVLLCAQAGLAAMELAETFAQHLLCHSKGADYACGVCRSCTSFAAGAHPDCWRASFVEDKKSIGVDQIRELSASLALRPQIGARQIAMIYPAEAMTVAAANALLKTLEEPAADTVLILMTEQPGSLLPTIRSRCQRFDLLAPERNAALAWLQQRVSAAQAQIELALDIAAGAPIAALTALQNGGLQQHDTWRQWLARAQAGHELRMGRELANDAENFVRFYQFELRNLMLQHPGNDSLLLAAVGLQQASTRILDLLGTGVRIDLAFAQLLSTHWKQVLKPQAVAQQSNSLGKSG